MQSSKIYSSGYLWWGVDEGSELNSSEISTNKVNQINQSKNNWEANRRAQNHVKRDLEQRSDTLEPVFVQKDAYNSAGNSLYSIVKNQNISLVMWQGLCGLSFYQNSEALNNRFSSRKLMIKWGFFHGLQSVKHKASNESKESTIVLHQEQNIVTGI